jgi:hypothetical protein
MGQKIKVSGLNTEVILIKKCCAKNSIKKFLKAHILFLAIDDFNNADCAIRFNNLFYE